MSKYYNDTDYSGSSGFAKKPRKKPWVIALKVVAWCLGCLIVLAGIALWIFSYYVSPDHVTHLIEEKSSEYLKADVKIGKLDYKFFSSYPWLEFEVDSLSIISKSLLDVPADIKESLPQYSDSLAFVSKLKGEINIHSLFHHELKLKGIEIESPKVNIVVVNDSVANYNIADKLPKVSKMPDVNIAEIKVLPIVDLRYFSLPDNMEVKAEVEDFFLAQGKDKNYDIGFDGFVDGRYGEFTLPSNIPVKFRTGLYLNLPDMAINLKDLSIALAGLAFEANGDIKVHQTGIDIDEAEFKIKVEDLFGLIDNLPAQIAELIQLPEGLDGLLPLDLKLNLLSPVRFDKNKNTQLSVEDLPSISALLTIDDAHLSFRPPHGKKVVADDIYLEAFCNYNNENSEESRLEIKELRMHGEGISIDGNLNVDNLTGEQQGFEGNIDFNTPLLESLSYFLPQSSMKVAGLLKGNVIFSGKTKNLGKDGVSDIQLEGDIKSGALAVNSPGVGGNFNITNLKGDYKVKIPSYPLTDYQGTKMALDFKADSIKSKISGVNIQAGKFDIKLDAIDTVSGNPDPDGDLLVNVGGLKIIDGKTSFRADKLNIKASGTLNSGGSASNYTTVPAFAPGNDSILAARVSHTPLVLEYNGGGLLQTIMNLISVNADIYLGKVDFRSPSYLLPLSIDGMDIKTDLNNVNFTANDILLSKTSFSVTGKVEGLQPFMTSYAATPLKANAEIDFTNVDINQLSWGYFGALIEEGKDSVFYLPPLTPFTATDSTCVAIPRNIDAVINLSSQSAEYMQYRFSPLSTVIILKDGNATLSHLTVGAPYCTAIVDWTYSTQSLDNIFMDLKADVKNFTFTPFYSVFPSLVDKAPELKNFTGVLNADIGCRFGMFPDMFMNPQSLEGTFQVKGSDMEFARQGKFEKITHLMLIEGDEPIHIENMDITGVYHDNLLQVNPFKIKFDDYQLEFAGVNNVAGDIYYHLALEKSPFHLPFGVTLLGKLKHPEIRLGGTHINDYKAELVTTDEANSINVNIMAWLKHGWLMFIQEAAKYEGKINEQE